jgi:hypothetical protein
VISVSKYSVLIHVTAQVEYIIEADDDGTATDAAEKEFANDRFNDDWVCGKNPGPIEQGDKYLGTEILDIETVSVEPEGVGHFGA